MKNAPLRAKINTCTGKSYLDLLERCYMHQPGWHDYWINNHRG